jgi:cytochrome c-type biogenesis protein CcmH/NrfG
MYWLLGLIQAYRQDFDESLAALQRAVHLSPQTPRMHGALGRTCALAGRRRRPRSAAKAGELRDRAYVSPLEFAWISSRSGTSTSASTG